VPDIASRERPSCCDRGRDARAGKTGSAIRYLCIYNVTLWRAQQLTSATAKLIIYRAFVEDELDAPKHLARRVHELYFAPGHEDFQPRTMWSLSNAFTSAFKELDPIPQFKATAKPGPYLERVLGC